MSGIIWNAPKALGGLPAAITPGSAGKFTAVDLTADADDVYWCAVQLEFTVSLSVTGSIDVKIAAKLGAATGRQGGENEPNTLTLVEPIPINGNSVGYVSPLMVLNDLFGGASPTDFQVAVVNNLTTGNIVLSAGNYRTAGTG